MNFKNNIDQLLSIMAQLRDEELGCVWDKKQTFESIIPYTIEETYEVVEAINKQDWNNLQEELGDLLYQIVFYAQMAKEAQLFDFNDVVDVLNEKLVRRHPHVFGDSKLNSEEEINAEWDKIKQQERKNKSNTTAKSILDSIPTGLPLLLNCNLIF